MANMVDKQCATTDYFTPPEVLSVVKRYFKNRGYKGIELDPATTSKNPVKAWKFYSEGGLDKRWVNGTFINPPYGRVLQAWTEKIWKESSHGIEIIALLPGQRFETGYWQQYVLSGRLVAICMIRGRLSFRREDGSKAKSNPYGSMLYLYNGDYRTFRSFFSHMGKVIGVSY